MEKETIAYRLGEIQGEIIIVTSKIKRIENLINEIMKQDLENIKCKK